MKKLFILSAVAAFMLASCGQSNNNAGKTSESAPAESTTSTLSAPVETSVANTDVPKFSSPEAQQLAQDYAAFINEAIATAKSGDSKKMEEIATKAQEWATKAQAAAAKMTPEDAKLWAEYAQKMATKITGGH